MADLSKKYQEKIAPVLKKELELDNDLAVPRIEKIVVNTGITQEQGRQDALESMSQQLAQVTGQSPVITRAKKSISGFNLREGDPVGLRVTLRRRKMYDFLEKLIKIVLPRVKDFQGTKLHAFDGKGNYSLGLEEQLIFPEIDYDKIDKVRGLQVTIVTSAQEDREARRLLELLGMPFAKER